MSSTPQVHKKKFVSPLLGPQAPKPSTTPSSGLKRKAPDDATSAVGGSSSRKPPAPAQAAQPERNPFYGYPQLQKEAGRGASTSGETYWNVQWRKPQQKKHKTWDGDGVLVVTGNRCVLKNEEGKDIGSAQYTAGPVQPGLELKVGGKEVEVDNQIARRDYASGICFSGQSSVPTPTAMAAATVRVSGPAFKPIVPTKGVSYNTAGTPLPNRKSSNPNSPAAPLRPPPEALRPKDSNAEASSSRQQRPPAPPSPPKDKPVAKAPPISNFNLKSKPRFDPQAEGAVVMKRPSKAHQEKNSKGLDLVDVVLDPFLSEKMRPHQKDGLKFMYECVMGMKKVEGQGVIMADEMGLGKTLQTIALCWTLLKQSPYVGPGRTSVIGKALIVCPVTLTENWRKEFTKWLGRDRLGVMIGSGDKSEIKRFVNSTRHQVLVIGYEKLRSCIEDLKHCRPSIDLIVCDEGHRLKSKDAKTSKMFDHLKSKRRVILSGTPLQNDLHEYWSMVDFVNPGILDSYSAFNKLYEKPILKSRDAKCNKSDQELGAARSAKLAEIGKQFVIRRYAKDILSKYLPPKCEYVVFVAPTKLQMDVLSKLLEPSKLKSMTGITAQALALIGQARKVCNSPALLLESDEAKAEAAIPTLQAARALIPARPEASDMTSSGKMIALADLLHQLRATTEEKIVLVSNFTQTLDVFEAHCKQKKYRYERLDGKTPPKKRQESVERFNRSTQLQCFVFLLSAKSGGAGLNLIGASRLVMFDSDWNPSVDLQAMARVHRDGQKRKVFIYRFLTAGSIEEKIYQRQITKMGLSSSVLDDDMDAGGGQTSAGAFSQEELRDIFTFNPRTACQTHDAMGCDCLQYEALEEDEEEPAACKSTAQLKMDLDENSDEESDQPYITKATNVRPEKSKAKENKDKQASLAALKEWTHVECLVKGASDSLQDDILRVRVNSNFKSSSKSRLPKPSVGTSQVKPRIPVIDSDDDDDDDEDPDSDAFESVIDEDEVMAGSDVEVEDLRGAVSRPRASSPTSDDDGGGVVPAGSSRTVSDGPDDDEDSISGKPLVAPGSPAWPSSEDEVEAKGSSALKRTGDVQMRHADPDGSDDDEPALPSSKPAKPSGGSKRRVIDIGLSDDDDSDSDLEAPYPPSAQPPRARGSTASSTSSSFKDKGKATAPPSTGKPAAGGEVQSGLGQTDLRQLAANGQAGRITFLFEKLTSPPPL